MNFSSANKNSNASAASKASTAFNASTASKNKVLIITYYWPPSGGAGVQRWVKFARYLPEFGWEPVILTVDPVYAAYPVTDDSLAKEIPSTLKVFTTRATDYFTLYKKDRTKIPSAGFASNRDDSFKGKLMRFIRGNFFIPDPRKGWNRFAYEKASELIKQFDIKNVITTSPPHSTQLIGLKLKKDFPSINWIADLRDPWTDIYYYDQFYPTFISKMIDNSYEKNVLVKADRIITVGQSLKDLFSEKLELAFDKTDIISNGYDEDDFSHDSFENPPVFTITYAGTVSDAYPLKSIMSALKLVLKSGNEFKMRFIGTVAPERKKLIEESLPESNLEFIPYQQHSEIIKFLCSSSALLLIIPDHSSNRSIITGKIFEYIASRKPVICIGPEDGDAAFILKESGAGKTFAYNKSGEMSAYITRLIKKEENTMTADVSKYSRKELTRRLAGILKM